MIEMLILEEINSIYNLVFDESLSCLILLTTLVGAAGLPATLCLEGRL
jgi:hypothetical protein